MSFWSEWLDSVKNLPSAFLGIQPSSVVRQAAPSFIPTQVVGGQNVTPQVQAGAQTTTTNALKAAGIAPIEQAANTINTAARPVTDPVLWVGDKAEKYVFSPMARGISTTNLLTDVSSPLYENGFQFSDVRAAWNRSEKVSLGQSMLKSSISPLGFVESKILEANGVNVSEIDLWNDKDIQKNFVDNTLGKWITGTNDFVIKNVAAYVLTDGAAAIAKAGAVRAGLTTSLKAADIGAMPKYENDIYQHIAKVETGQGSYSVLGQDVMDLAAADNIIDITRITSKHSFNQQLPGLIAKTKDPRIVADFLLADKGYGPAIERLAAARLSDDLWVLGDGTATFVSEYINTGKLPTHTPEQRARWAAAFDDAIAKEPKHKEIYDAFLREEFDPVTGDLKIGVVGEGKLYRPMEPKLLKEEFGAARSKAGKWKTAITERDFTNPELAGIAQTVLGGGLKRPTTVLLRNLGTYMPKGIVTHSGLRPLDGVQELISVFDDVPLFRDGSRIITTHDMTQMTVSQYRQNLISKFVDAASDGERDAILKQANKDLAKTIAFSRDYWEAGTIDNFVDSLLEDVGSVHGQFKAQGFATDPTGVRLVLDPRTQRQLANSTAMLPFGELDRMILKSARKAKGPIRGVATSTSQFTGAAAKGLFEASNKIFSFAQLYRFSYIPKNSVFEPILAATLAEGGTFTGPLLKQASRTAISDFGNFVSRNISKSKTLLPSAKKEIQEEVKTLAKQYDQAIINRDLAYAQYEEMFANVPGVSPATKRDWADTIRETLRDAENDVARLEQQMNVYTIELGGKPINVPSIYGLRARIQTLKEAGNVRYSSEIRQAELAIQKAVGDINTLAPELNEATSKIADSYAQITKALEELGEANVRMADIFKVTDGKYVKRPLLPEVQTAVLKNGQVVEFPSFASRKSLGDAYMSEIASSGTRNLEMLGNKATVIKMNTILKKSPRDITPTGSPLYFSELEYLVNNQMRGDILVDRILAGETRDSLIKNWSKTKQARSYAEAMGRSEDDIVKIIDEQMGFVGRYLPTPEARMAALENSVTENQLRALLGDKLDQMVPIHPLEVDYAKPTTVMKNINAAIDSAFATSWNKLLKPENMIREVWGTVKHQKLVQQRVTFLESQGHEIDVAMMNRITHAAAIEVVDGVKSVFYTVPRQHRALYLARGLATFPNAAASGIIRYSKFALKNPARFSVFTNSYYSYYGSFGLDQYGNPVENPMDAVYLLIPGTKELGLNNGQGIKISSRATNFMMNFPGASWLVPVALTAVTGGRPDATATAKDVIDKTFGNIPGYSYDELFPYGIESSVKDQLWNTFTPAWGRNLRQYLSPDLQNEMFVNTWMSVANYQGEQYELKKGPAPTYDSIMNQARDIYLRKARTQMFSIIGAPQVVESQPDSVYQDIFFMEYNALVAKNATAKKKLSNEQLWTQAEKNFQAKILKSTGEVFPMDRLWLSNATDTAGYITPSVTAYKRIWGNNSDLVNKLISIDPSVVGLIAADVPKEFDIQTNKFLNSTTATFPDGTPVNSKLKTPQMMEKELEISRTWSAYSEYRDYLNGAAKEAGYASYLSIPEAREALSKYANETLKEYNRDWWNEYSGGAKNIDSSWAQSQALFTIVNDDAFMSKYGKTQFWQHAKAFVAYRNSVVAAYKDAPTGYKSKVQEQWVAYLNESLPNWDPTLQKIITRYFQNDKMKGNS